MSTKENFVKALRELTGFDDSNTQGTPSPSQAVQEPIRFEAEMPKEDLGFHANLKDSYEKVRREDFGDKDDSKTCIPKGMKIIGNLESNGRIEMLGRVEGDIETAGDIIVAGSVVGNVVTGNMLLQKGAVKGNVSAKGDVIIEQESVVLGDINAENLKLDGKVKGDIVIANLAELTSAAIVNGNIETNMISTSRGTRIKGNILTRQNGDFDADAEFDIEV